MTEYFFLDGKRFFIITKEKSSGVDVFVKAGPEHLKFSLLPQPLSRMDYDYMYVTGGFPFCFSS